MDPFEELERMASIAEASNSSPPTAADIDRWTKLFQYTAREASMLITAHRSDVTRSQIPDEHWSLVREERESAGFDREAYEHALSLKDILDSQSSLVYDEYGKKWILFRLGGLLGTPEKVMDVAGLEELPKVTKGYGEMTIGWFCWIDEQAKAKIDAWMLQQQVL